MPEPLPKYRKLPGRGTGIFGFTRLWMGEDHLLSVHSMFGVERYRRFYFRSIEAFVIRDTKVRFGWNIAYGTIATLLLSIGGLSWLAFKSDSAPGFAFGFLAVFGSIGAACLLLLLVNTLMGPSCALYVQTAAGLERLGAPVRTRSALKILARLRPEIFKAQGAISEADFSSASAVPAAAEASH